MAHLATTYVDRNKHTMVPPSMARPGAFPQQQSRPRRQEGRPQLRTAFPVVRATSGDQRWAMGSAVPSGSPLTVPSPWMVPPVESSRPHTWGEAMEVPLMEAVPPPGARDRML